MVAVSKHRNWQLYQQIGSHNNFCIVLIFQMYFYILNSTYDSISLLLGIAFYLLHVYTGANLFALCVLKHLLALLHVNIFVVILSLT